MSSSTEADADGCLSLDVGFSEALGLRPSQSVFFMDLCRYINMAKWWSGDDSVQYNNTGAFPHRLSQGAAR